MVVTDKQFAALRAHLVGDDDEYDRLCEDPNPVDAQRGFSLLLAAAFVEAVNRRFGQDRSNADIVKFVAKVRIRYGDVADELDARHAERLIQIALGDLSQANDLDEVAKQLQIPLLGELIADQNLADARLDDFLAAVRVRAESMLL